jgi:hypothetical protein
MDRESPTRLQLIDKRLREPFGPCGRSPVDGDPRPVSKLAG